MVSLAFQIRVRREKCQLVFVSLGNSTLRSSYPIFLHVVTEQREFMGTPGMSMVLQHGPIKRTTLSEYDLSPPSHAQTTK